MSRHSTAPCPEYLIEVTLPKDSPTNLINKIDLRQLEKEKENRDRLKKRQTKEIRNR